MLSMAKTAAGGLDAYVCPACKKSLRRENSALCCEACSQTYATRQGIPEFLAEELSQSLDPELRRMMAIDKMARIYETNLWYPVVLAVYGGLRSPSLPRLIGQMCRNVQSAKGPVLDVACGPGTFGRRVASGSREVYGIDVSRGMLRQGAAYAAREGIANMHFARARVEALPFEDRFFDAAICCGSLHLFADTAAALDEMARVMKPGGILSVFTFTAGDGSLRIWNRQDTAPSPEVRTHAARDS
jgi:SAM-dependent methyltransferase